MEPDMISARTCSTLLALAVLAACGRDSGGELGADPAKAAGGAPTVAQRLARYTTVRLSADTSALTPNERRMIPILIEAARAMDPAYWVQAYGNRDSLMQSITDSDTRRLVEINYGPWDRLDNDAPFVAGVGPKPAGANLYPHDMTKSEFDSAVARSSKARADSLRSLYTLVRRDASGELVAVPYSRAFAEQHQLAASKLREAAKLADDPGLRRYLEALARALLTDDYRPSDLAWMDMKNNTIDVILGPIETYEDQLFGYKTAHEAYILIKDKEWSKRLARYATLLPSLQRALPVPAEYKRETPGTDSDLNAYFAAYYAGQANAGAKTIAINLPNDEEVQLRKGTRRLQLENVMRAKFDEIMTPIAAELIAPEQLPRVNFDSFFENTMFHEVAHGLGIKNTINGRGTVREALKERASALEEEKADVLGLYMVQTLIERGEIAKENVADNYVTFLAGIFRSVRFGASSAHGRANMATFNFLREQNAFTRDDATGHYSVDATKMRAALDSLTATILRLQGDGDYDGVGAFYDKYGTIPPQLQSDLDRLNAKGIPVDIVFEQGR
jgi:hypothetical protein